MQQVALLHREASRCSSTGKTSLIVWGSLIIARSAMSYGHKKFRVLKFRVKFVRANLYLFKNPLVWLGIKDFARLSSNRFGSSRMRAGPLLLKSSESEPILGSIFHPESPLCHSYSDTPLWISIRIFHFGFSLWTFSLDLHSRSSFWISTLISHYGSPLWFLTMYLYSNSLLWISTPILHSDSPLRFSILMPHPWPSSPGHQPTTLVTLI